MIWILEQLGIFSTPFSDIPIDAWQGISENRYPVSDNRILNCKGVASSYIKGGEIAMWYPFELKRKRLNHRTF